jgi:hypothetical protein
MGNKNMNNIYKKLHNACNTASSVKKATKVKGMHFNPLLHDDVLRVSMEALLGNGLYPTCSYITEVNDKCVIVTCTMKIHDVDAPDNFVIIDGCTAMGGIDKFGTGQAMSYARKYAFLNALNLKTGLDLEDGYNATPFKEIPKAKANGTDPTYLDEEIDVEEIKDDFKNTTSLQEFNEVNERYKKGIQYLIRNNPKVYQQVKDVADTRKLQLNNNK